MKFDPEVMWLQIKLVASERVFEDEYTRHEKISAMEYIARRADTNNWPPEPSWRNSVLYAELLERGIDLTLNQYKAVCAAARRIERGK